MGRYVVSFALLAGLGTMFFSLFGDGTLPEILSDTFFNAFIGGALGLLIGLGARALVGEIQLPSNEDESEAEQLEAEARLGKPAFPTEEEIEREREVAEETGARIAARVARQTAREQSRSRALDSNATSPESDSSQPGTPEPSSASASSRRARRSEAATAAHPAADSEEAEPAEEKTAAAQEFGT